MDFTELLTTIEENGITVKWARLSTINAGWDPTTRTIWLDNRLDGINAKCILAHEYAHALLGHDTHQHDDGHETHADIFASRLLINPVEYALAEQLHGTSTVNIADELGVTRWAVDAYRAWLATRPV